MAASPPMHEMFASGGGPVLGRTVDEFMTDHPSGALDLLRAGQLQGYVTTRSLRRRQEEPMPVQVWVRGLGKDLRRALRSLCLRPPHQDRRTAARGCALGFDPGRGNVGREPVDRPHQQRRRSSARISAI